jgi:hypothetical protein
MFRKFLINLLFNTKILIFCLNLRILVEKILSYIYKLKKYILNTYLIIDMDQNG